MAEGRDAEQLGGERLDVAGRYPRRAQAGVDVAGQHVLRLDGTQRLGVAGIAGPAPARRPSFARTLPDR